MIGEAQNKGLKVHIVGGPGSGKTMLAKQIAAALSQPFYEMDLIGWEGGAGAERPLEVKLADVQRIADQPGWVTDGGHLEWMEELYRAADYIVWLDLPWRIAGWRIVSRHFRASLAGTNRHRGLLKLWRFYLGARRNYHSTDPTFGRMKDYHTLQPYMEKVVHCRRPADVEALSRRIVMERQDHH